jgi:hypothetical protein
MARRLGGQILGESISSRSIKSSTSRPTVCSMPARKPSTITGVNNLNTWARNRSCTGPSLSSSENCTKREWCGMSCQFPAFFRAAISSGGTSPSSDRTMRLSSASADTSA